MASRLDNRTLPHVQRLTPRDVLRRAGQALLPRSANLYTVEAVARMAVFRGGSGWGARVVYDEGIYARPVRVAMWGYPRAAWVTIMGANIDEATMRAIIEVTTASAAHSTHFQDFNTLEGAHEYFRAVLDAELHGTPQLRGAGISVTDSPPPNHPCR